MSLGRGKLGFLPPKDSCPSPSQPENPEIDRDTAPLETVRAGEDPRMGHRVTMGKLGTGCNGVAKKELLFKMNSILVRR
jgi:hypothetical protein